MTRRARAALAACAGLALAAPAWAQQLDFHVGATDDAALGAAVRDLAGRLLPVYQESNTERYLANLSALQLVTGNYAGAWSTRQSLLERQGGAAHPVRASVVYDLYARARAIDSQERIGLPVAYERAFEGVVPRLHDPDAYTLDRWLRRRPSVLRRELLRTLEALRGQPRIGTPAALGLVWAWLAYDAARVVEPTAAILEQRDERRRYVVEDDLSIETPDGAHIPAVMVRPRAAGPQPALLEFTLNADPRNDPMECAAHGYVGVFAFTRNSRHAPGQVAVFDHDGGDADAVIDWIAQQPWSDGRVAMYGSRYGGFTAWAAARRLPKALKAIAVTNPIAPGVDFPMRGSIFRAGAFRWTFDATNDVAPDEISTGDAQWRDLEQRWYRSGRSFRDLDTLYGMPSDIFHRWLDHPAYDRYWRGMVPYQREFARVGIPVLTITGYYAPGAPGALYYFTQHLLHDPHADDTLLMGPWSDDTAEGLPPDMLQGYALDAAALVDLHELRYQWFDYVFGRGPRPALLADRVNYEVMGANEWQHAPSLAAAAPGALRLFLDAQPHGEPHHLGRRPPQHPGYLLQSVNLADRSDAGWSPPAMLVTRTLSPHAALTFVSDPLPRDLDVAGQLRGHLDLSTNRRDLDLAVQLYELRPDGSYLELFDPAYEFRASFARDRSRRHLLRPGVRTQLAFTAERLLARRLQAGSRIVLVLGVNKRIDQEINYGTGRDVSRESVADAKTPVTIRWYDDSYIELPARR